MYYDEHNIGDTVVVVSNRSYEYGGNPGERGVVGTKGIVTEKTEMTNSHTGFVVGYRYSLDYNCGAFDVMYDGTTFEMTRLVLIEKDC